MIYIKAHITSNGVPVPGALITVSDRSGKTITRNNTQVIRESNQDGNFIIPVLEIDYITIAKAGYAPVTIRADETIENISLQATKHTGKTTLVSTLQFFALVAPLVSILFMVYQFYLLNKKS